ncbi:MAG TPA: hypothetical protein PKE46_13905 [Micropruina sp.]|nr:hypothetical protein [Micropruina sp.]
MADCRTSLQVQTRKDIENDVTANFDRLVAMVRKAMAHRYGGRIPPGFEADHWVLEAYRKALDHLDRLSDEPAAHTDFLRRWTRRDYVVAVAINAATDAARPIGDRIAPEEAQQEQKEVPDREAQALEDGVVERLDGARRRTALNVIVRALVWRAGTAGATGITAEQWETMHAFMTVRKASVLDDETDDATLHWWSSPVVRRGFMRPVSLGGRGGGAG